MTTEQIINRVGFVEPDEDQLVKIQHMRSAAEVYLKALESQVPDGRAKAIAVTKIEEALMWANKGISHGKET